MDLRNSSKRENSISSGAETEEESDHDKVEQVPLEQPKISIIRERDSSESLSDDSCSEVFVCQLVCIYFRYFQSETRPVSLFLLDVKYLLL